MPETTAKEVAKYFIKISNSSKNEITNLKLQKLVYYAQAWFVTLNNGNPLFDDPIEAWVLGPAIKSLFNTYRKYGSEPIKLSISDTDIHLSGDIIAFLDQVFNVYGQFKASELVQMTHSEDPWIKARASSDILKPSNVIITIKSMHEYYSSKIQ